MDVQNRCDDVAVFHALELRKERNQALATSAETIAEALYRKPVEAFDLESAVSAFGCVRARRR